MNLQLSSVRKSLLTMHFRSNTAIVAGLRELWFNVWLKPCSQATGVFRDDISGFKHFYSIDQWCRKWSFLSKLSLTVCFGVLAETCPWQMLSQPQIGRPAFDHLWVIFAVKAYGEITIEPSQLWLRGTWGPKKGIDSNEQGQSQPLFAGQIAMSQATCDCRVFIFVVTLYR